MSIVFQQKPIRIIIFDDNENLGHSLVTLLNTRDNYEVVDDYCGVTDVIKETFSDVVIMNIEMPEEDGISTVLIIKENYSEAAIIMYSQQEDEDKLFSSISAGADGYILKKTMPQLLLRPLKKAAPGGSLISIHSKKNAWLVETTGQQKQIRTYKERN